MSTVVVKNWYCVVLWVTLQALVFGERINITSGAQDYFKAAQHHLLHSIELAELKIESAEASFASRLDVIHFNQHQILHEIYQVHQNLMPLESLSIVRKHCIQKYAPQLVTRNTARSELKNCEERIKLGIQSLTTKAKSDVNSAKNYALDQFVANVKTCSSTHLKNETAMELCFVENVESASKTIGNHLRSAQEYLERSSFESSVISRNAMRCTYQVTSEILKSLGASLRDISHCQKNFIPDTSPLEVEHHKDDLNLKSDVNQENLENIDNNNENEIRREYEWEE